MDKIIHYSTHIKCDTKQAFEMFTENKLLPMWLPHLAEVEPRVGGKYELFWDPNDKENNSTIGCKVTAIEPNRLIAFEWKGPTEFQEFMNKADPLTHVVVLFVDCSEDPDPCTIVHLVHSGWKRSAVWEKARKYFEKAWKHAFEKLRAVISEKGHKPRPKVWSYLV